MSDRMLMTQQDYDQVKAELERLETVERAEIAERIRTAREWGDLKENSEYHDAKNDQAHLETKILRIREQLLNAEVREVQTGTDMVGFGSCVEVEDAKSGKQQTYTLLSAHEADPTRRRARARSRSIRRWPRRWSAPAWGRRSSSRRHAACAS